MANRKGLGILTLIIGISGLGLGVYKIMFPHIQDVDTNFGIQNTWFKYDSAMYGTAPIGAELVIATLTINFTVNSGESAYFLFNTYAFVAGAELASI
ncbi:MAG: hypothetical protein ACFFG0_22025 [Candidatus Thorarchaeota archaeon]